MDRIIEVKVCGNHLTKDSKNAGTRGEANVTKLRITFDESWDKYNEEYAKKIVFWDAYGQNPTPIVLTTNLLEDITQSTRVYIVPIPEEAMARAGLMTFSIKGYADGKKQVSVTSKMEVQDSPDMLEPIDPTPSQAEQLQVQVDKIKEDIQGVANAKAIIEENVITARTYSESAEGQAKISEENAIKAEATLGKTNYIGENGNWYAWDSTKSEFYDTGVRAQSGSIVYYGDNPPEEADIWIDPEGDGDGYTRAEADAKFQDKLTDEQLQNIADVANKADKAEVEAELNIKADKATTLEGYGITDAYDKETVDDRLLAFASSLGSLSGAKADRATTLAGYGIADAYAKGETDAKFQNIKESIYREPDNLFKGDVIEGGYYENGSWVDNVSWKVLKLPLNAVRPGDTLTFSQNCAYYLDRYRIDYHDVNGNYIGNSFSNGTPQIVLLDYGDTDFYITVRVKTAESNFVIVKDGILETLTYTDYIMKRDVLTNHPIKNKVINCLGDSFTSGKKSWCGILARRLNITCNNYGVGGTRISIDATSGPSFINRVQDMDASADITIIFGGINDSASITYGSITLGDMDSPLDNTTFYGALRLLIESIKNHMPGKKIIGVVPPDFMPTDTYINTLPLVQQACREVYEYYSIPYADLKKDCQEMYEDEYNIATFRRGSEDNYHPSYAGHVAISEVIQGVLDKYIKN